MFYFIIDILFIGYDAVESFVNWWRKYDLDGSVRREAWVAKSITDFEEEGTKSVIDADESSTLFYGDEGYYLECRKSKRTVKISQAQISKYVNKGMRGLRREKLKLKKLR